MRQIVLDTETTGLDATQHRVIEIGCIEVIDRRPTRRAFHHYLNPERAVDAGALAVHGLDDEFLADKPRFAQIADDLLEFLRGAELVIHNAPFDLGFLDAEFRRLNPAWTGLAEHCRVLDTLALARERHPGQRNSLDALCRRYQVDNSDRALHGARLDAMLLCEVYLAMTGGQGELLADHVAKGEETAELGGPQAWPRPLPVMTVPAAALVAHARRLESIGKQAGGLPLWLLESAANEPA
ncbi:MAG TPA: DNA polymerase III subunit epsilon [Gammaproteobacteria bacterium]|nr:DNA polymerase III subunit epsilon [Gammaproteobacteria bacterium]